VRARHWRVNRAGVGAEAAADGWSGNACPTSGTIGTTPRRLRRPSPAILRRKTSARGRRWRWRLRFPTDGTRSANETDARDLPQKPPFRIANETETRDSG